MGRRKRGPNDTVENDIGWTVHDQTTMVSCADYQQFRDRRIKENQERLQKLGILDLSLKLKSKVVSAKRISREKKKKPLHNLQCLSLLQGVHPRIGKKTPGQHTHCSKCNMVQGQFCGDYLYMRYGGNVTEANQNPSWICPVCWGIAIAVFVVRQKDGCPLVLHRKVMRLGYESMAHFLIQSHCSPTNLENSGVEVPEEKLVPMAKSFLHEGSGEIGIGPEGFSTSQPQELMYDNAKEEVEKVHLGHKKYVNTNGKVNKDAYDSITYGSM